MKLEATKEDRFFFWMPFFSITAYHHLSPSHCRRHATLLLTKDVKND